MERFAYFMVRVRHSACSPHGAALEGVVERLASREKRRFASADELLRLMAGWPEPPAEPDGTERGGPDA